MSKIKDELKSAIEAIEKIIDETEGNVKAIVKNALDHLKNAHGSIPDEEAPIDTTPALPLGEPKEEDKSIETKIVEAPQEDNPTEEAKTVENQAPSVDEPLPPLPEPHTSETEENDEEGKPRKKFLGLF